MSASMFYRGTFDHSNVQINRTFLNTPTREIIYFMAPFHGREYLEWFSSNVRDITIYVATKNRDITYRGRTVPYVCTHVRIVDIIAEP